MSKITASDMVEKYRRTRMAVYEEATKPYYGGRQEHEESKIKLKNHIVRLCEDSNLDLYRGSGKQTAMSVWHHFWTKNRYAGIRAQIAATEILDVQTIFDDYDIFSRPSWDFTSSGHKLISAGKDVNDFLNRQGVFYGKQTIGNLPKLRKIVGVARKLKAYVDKDKEAPILNFITNGFEETDVWRIHQHLLDIGYTSDLTALHFMMDLGFDVIKPDIVIAKLFLTWGWLHEIIPELPSDLTLDDLQGKGNYGARFKYTHPKMYKPVINLASDIVSQIDQDALRSDIDWVTNNPLREFDIFTVKYGQQPEKEWGISRTLFDENLEIYKDSKSCATKLPT